LVSVSYLLYPCKDSLIPRSAMCFNLCYNASISTKHREIEMPGCHSGESLNVGDCLPEDEGVDIICSLIGIRDLEIGNMPADMILI